MKKKQPPLCEEEPLSAEEIALLGTLEDRSTLPPHDTSDRAGALRFAKRNPLLIVSAIVILLALIASAVIGIVLWVRYAKSQPSTADFTLILGEEEQKISYGYAMRDGILFLDARKLFGFAGMITLGSDERIKFASPDGQYLRFEHDSPLAVINGAEVEMSAKAVVNKNECLVPYSFLDKVISRGLTIQWEITTNVITVKRQKYSDTLEPAALLFSSDGFEILRSLKSTDTKEITVDDYPIDITPYLSSINPTGMPDMLVLANKQHALGEDYAPSDLVVLNTIGIRSKDESQQLRSPAAYALKAMLTAMATEAPTAIKDLIVTSSYRSYAYQNWLFYDVYVSKHMAEGMTREQAEAAASAYSSRPGESEHQTGLCFDFIMDGGQLDTDFENTEAFTWLSENAHLYGFILRYPVPPSGSYEEPHPITGYSYEPWHYRFVGRDAAVTVYESQITFEEYLELN